jgi:hypothetical protein
MILFKKFNYCDTAKIVPGKVKLSLYFWGFIFFYDVDI